MSDKEQLIKEEIERLYNLYELSNDYQRMGACSTILDFIDSLPEEPASKDLEEATHKYSREWYAKRIGTNPKCNGCYSHIKDAFTAGAKWQKQQMMKEAVEGTIKYEIGSAEIPQCDKRYQVLSDPTPIANAKLGEKVKIIIVKPEQQ